MSQEHPDLAACVRQTLTRYFSDLNGEKPAAIYDMVLASIERPMLEVVLEQSGGNQTLAADMLGINRNTLRRKLTEHNLK